MNRFSLVTAWVALATGVLVFLGWEFDIAVLKSVVPDFPMMKANTALGFVLTGVGLIQLHSENVRRSRLLARFCGIAAAMLGALTLAEYASGWDFRIDDLLFRSAMDAAATTKGRMSPASALIFLIFGVTLLLLGGRRSIALRAIDALLMLALVMGMVALLGYLYHVSALYQFRVFSAMAVHTAVLIVVLSAALLAATPPRGVAAFLVGDNLGATLARRLLPVALLAPPLVGYLRLMGQRKGYYGTELGLALFATSNVMIFTVVIFLAALSLRRTDLRRHASEDRLAHQLERLNLLSVITRSIGDRLDLPSISQLVISMLEDQLPVHFGCLCLYQPPDGLTVIGIGTKSRRLAVDIGLTEQGRVPIDANGLSRCVRGQLVYESDVREVPFAFPQRLAAAGLHAMVAAPLMLESKVFGVLIVARHAADSFSSGECEFLKQLSEHVAVAAHQTQLYGALEVAYEDLRQTQQAVMRQEKLRVLGQMASGIGHDINNALSPAALYVESLIERKLGDSEAQEHLQIIQRAIEGVAQTVARMKEFYSERDPLLAHVPMSINQAVEQVIDLTKARWSAMQQESGRIIHVKIDLANELPSIAGNASEMRDAITNLIVNAADAMPEGGILTVSSCVVGAGSVQLVVKDTGIGMDEATRSRCLELFFTTKGARGTGLGLAMVYGTVERHGGEIQIESAPGAGTTFRLIFPVVSAPRASGGGIAVPPRPQQPLRILVIDDDPIILKSLAEMFERDGHFVEAADGGERGVEAFRAAQARSEPFSVVITDLGMPYMDGKAVALAIKSLCPRTPVVLLTGWGHRMLPEDSTPANVDRVLSKPPKLLALRSTLAELTVGMPP